MIYLFLCVLSSTAIFIVFKIINRRSLPSFPIILINYLVAALLGFLLYRKGIGATDFSNSSSIPLAILIGILFILMFFIIARSTKEAGISITTVASKMSVVFPITVSILIDSSDKLTPVKFLAILLALVAVLLTVYSPETRKGQKSRILIPLLLFIGLGVVDSLVKFAQYKFLSVDETAFFSAFLFSIALLTGLLVLPFRKKGIREFRSTATWLFGGILGIVNFGSIYLLISALNHTNPAGETIDSSIIFGANNIGIVSLSVLAGLLLFRESLRPVNWTGIALSFLALVLFSIA